MPSSKGDAIISTFSHYINEQTLYKAYRQVSKGKKRGKRDAVIFHRYDMLLLEKLLKDLETRAYIPGEYNSFWVYEPKKRLINAPPFRDKIVQCVLHEALSDIYQGIYIKHSYACLTGRGQHRCAKQIQNNMRVCKRNYDDPWIVRIDVAKYFYSIDRDILKSLLRKQIKDPDLLWLCDIVIDSSPEGEKGIPLGNVSSQDVAHVYLNELDQFAVRYKGFKYYTRFNDDICIIVADREIAKNALEEAQHFLRDRLHLDTNKKAHILPLAQGMNSCGFKIHPTHMLLRDRSKNGMRRRLKAINQKVESGEISTKKARQEVSCWEGHAKHASTFRLRQKLFETYEFLNEV